MRGWALLTAVLFGLLQPLLLTDCPCAVLCSHKNECDRGSNSALEDCCARSAEGEGFHAGGTAESRCFHVEPQTELDRSEAGLADLPGWDAGDLPEAPLLGPSGSLESVPPSGLPPLLRSRLYLAQACLRI